ncbi:radical SAM protein [Candidatus Saccharibacteria bacterium]|nr:radical SAM protein [Candidatus Saccharibacteria bacterium]MCL1963400.1 radical SAM protein [Candidatus Saccharibacteria bacterium]
MKEPESSKVWYYEPPTVAMVGELGNAAFNQNQHVRELDLLRQMGARVLQIPDGQKLEDLGIHPDHMFVANSVLTPGNIENTIGRLLYAFDGATQLPKSFIFPGKFGSIKSDYFEPKGDFYATLLKQIIFQMSPDVGWDFKPAKIVKAIGPDRTRTIIETVFPDRDLSDIAPKDSFGFTEPGLLPECAKMRDIPSRFFILQTGCNNHCAYCSDRYLNEGENCSVSMPFDRAVAELREFRVQHPDEKHLTLGGRNLFLFGKNGKEGKQRLHELLPIVDEMGFDDVSLYFGMPLDLYPELVEAIKNSKTINGMHSTIETGSKAGSKRINRDGQLEVLESALTDIYAEKPNFVWSTTLLAGFPGETDAELNETCDFVKRNRGVVYRVGTLDTESKYITKPVLPIAELPDQLSETERQAHGEVYKKLQIEQAQEGIMRLIKDFLDGKKSRVSKHNPGAGYPVLLQNPISNYMGVYLHDSDEGYQAGEEVSVLPWGIHVISDAPGDILPVVILAARFDDIEEWVRDQNIFDELMPKLDDDCKQRLRKILLPHVQHLL